MVDKPKFRSNTSFTDSPVVFAFFYELNLKIEDVVNMFTK